MKAIYDVNYFIAKFEAIPDDKWITGSLGIAGSGKHCALGHCGVEDSKETEEAHALGALFGFFNPMEVWKVNDLSIFPEDQRIPIVALVENIPTPKQRILAALYDIKKRQEPKERVVYVTVDEKVRELQKSLSEN